MRKASYFVRFTSHFPYVRCEDPLLVKIERLHLRVYHVCVSDYCCYLRVTVSALGTFVDVCATYDGQTIIDDTDFGMNVHLEEVSNDVWPSDMHEPVQL